MTPRAGNQRWLGSSLAAYLTSLALVLQALFRLRMGWFLPLVLALFALALVLAILASAGPLAPFVYPLL